MFANARFGSFKFCKSLERVNGAAIGDVDSDPDVERENEFLVLRLVNETNGQEEKIVMGGEA